MIDVEIYIVGNEQVQLAVVIVIQEGRARGPTGIADVGALSNVRKRAVSVILEEMIWPQAGYVEIVKAIIIIVTNCDPHPPADISDARLVRYICKRAVAVIVIESASGFLIGFHEIHSQRVDKVNVQIAIIVIIEECDPPLIDSTIYLFSGEETCLKVIPAFSVISVKRRSLG